MSSGGSSGGANSSGSEGGSGSGAGGSDEDASGGPDASAGGASSGGGEDSGSTSAVDSGASACGPNTIHLAAVSGAATSPQAETAGGYELLVEATAPNGDVILASVGDESASNPRPVAGQTYAANGNSYISIRSGPDSQDYCAPSGGTFTVNALDATWPGTGAGTVQHANITFSNLECGSPSTGQWLNETISGCLDVTNPGNSIP
jgi:hypothetical protein